LGNEVSTNQTLVSGAIREIFVRKRRYYESAIRDALAAGAIEPCAPTDKATALFGAIDGMITQARILNDVSLLKHLPSVGMDLLRFRSAVSA
jgi:TetR/AcrR family transcriptional repressor of nem operon